MPVYTYECDYCLTKDECIRSIADRNDLPECRECGGPTSRRPEVAGVWAPSSKGMAV
jgi:putative FmdB family regulatory protein